jgi:predicted cobalt transporter CbtA
MVGTLLIRGMLAGVLAGVVAAIFGYLFGEPSVDLAIGFEQHMSKAAGASADPELFSRTVQSTIGLLTGLVVFGAAIGGIFGLAFAFAQGRLGRLPPRATAALLATAGFVVLVLIPQLKYPANPPAVGHGETIGSRTGFYFALIVLSVAAAIAALNLGRSLVVRFGGWNATLIGTLAYLLIMALISQVLPSIDEVPEQFSAALLWRFRIATIGVQFVLWAALGIAFGMLTERSLARAYRPAIDRGRG